MTLDDVKSIPVPHFTPAQIEQLATVQKELAQMEIERGPSSTQAFVDEQIAHIFQLPASISILATEFNHIRSTLLGGCTDNAAVKPPKEDDLHRVLVVWIWSDHRWKCGNSMPHGHLSPYLPHGSTPYSLHLKHRIQIVSPDTR